MPDKLSVEDLALEPIVAAARECFAQYGVHRTRMEDVATRARMARQTLYRYVANREQLVELALGARISELQRVYEQQVDHYAGPLENAVIDALVAPITVTREDEEFGRLAAALTRRPLSHVLAEHDSPSHEVAVSYLTPVLKRASDENRLRTDIPLEETIDWILMALVTVTPREDLSIEQIRHTFRHFMLPAILKP